MTRRLPAFLLAAATPLAVGLALAPAASAASTTVVVSEVYGGGGNAGAFYRSDFVELANVSTAAVDLTGWRVQYFSATGTTASSTTTLSGTVPPQRHYLVQQAAGANTGATALPTPDATGTAAMSSGSGRVVLLDAAGAVVDSVAYGASTPVEGTPTQTLSNTTSAARTPVCQDTDVNASDFVVGAPTPENTTVAAFTCVAGPPPVDEPETIEQIQGAAHLSPLNGKAVNAVHGIVTALTTNGFWMEDPAPDADPATSAGVFVFTRTAPTVAVGDDVLVNGLVTEFRPGGSGGTTNVTTTEITTPSVTLTASGASLPAPVVIGEDRVAPQQVVDAGNPGTVEAATAEFLPARDAIDFYESLEGMRVAVRDAQVVGPTASFGEIPVVPGTAVSALRSELGGVVYGDYSMPNAMRVQLDDALIGRPAMPNVNVGDTLPGLTSGVMDYSFANYKLLVTAAPAVATGPAVRETAPVQRDPELSVASFNVENLAPENPQEKFDRLAAQVVDRLRSPDILAIEEVQDDSGATNDGTVTAGVTVQRLLAAITAAGGPAYSAVWVDPTDLADGGQPGGNIRNVLLYRPDRDVTFTPVGTPSATTPATVVTDKQGRPHLSVNPGRIDPANAAWSSSRKPLVAEFKYRGSSVFVVAVHFASKGGDQPLFGRFQDPVRTSEVQRHAQALVVRGWADSLLGADQRAKLVVAGDVNDFEFSTTADLMVDTLEGTGPLALTDLPRTLPEGQRWTYVFEGNSQVLDHILLSQSLATYDTGHFGPWRPADGSAAFRYDIVHTNSPFWDQDSDHDPQVVQLDLKK